MTKIEAKIVKHSVNPFGDELITYELIFPRFILAELNVHRMFSKNSASSRAIPFKKMVEMVQNDPFIPIAFQKEHKGMQGSEYYTDENSIMLIRNNWLSARNNAVKVAEMLNEKKVTKQLCNRLLEPFMWHKVLLTTGKEGLQNFFELRCPQYNYENKTFRSWKNLISWYSNEATRLQDMGFDEIALNLSGFTILQRLQTNKGQAEIHMMELAEQMYDAYNESVPQKLESGQWHIPYEESIDALAYLNSECFAYNSNITENPELAVKLKASTGLCARTSYLTVGDDKNPSIETLIGIHDKMKGSVPFHASPFEHCARVATEKEYMYNVRGTLQHQGCETEKYEDGFSEDLFIPKSSQGWFRNYRGFIQYRHILENGTI